jgi:hypothetical protein
MGIKGRFVSACAVVASMTLGPWFPNVAQADEPVARASGAINVSRI